MFFPFCYIIDEYYIKVEYFDTKLRWINSKNKENKAPRYKEYAFSLKLSSNKHNKFIL